MHRHGGRFVESASERGKNALHDALDVMRVDETQVGVMQHTVTLDKDLARSVDEDFCYRIVAQQDFQRAETGQFVDQFFCQTLHFVA